ncbi:NHL repeat-containing protein [candidate division KSB1 bacterium]
MIYRFYHTAKTILTILILTASVSFAQDFPIPESAKLIINDNRGGKWGDNPEVVLKFERTIGNLESENENFMFYLPQDIAADRDGNKYILDAGNFRVLKFDKNWNFVRTFGQEGQGPGDLLKPLSIDTDRDGNIYVFDPGNIRIQAYNPEGRSLKTIEIESRSGKCRLFNSGESAIGGGLPKGVMQALKTGEPMDSGVSLIEVFTDNFSPIREFGIFRDFGNLMKNINGSTFYFAIDNEDNTYLSFESQNRIEKYNSAGELELRIERPLNFEEFIPAPEMKRVNSGGKAGAFMYNTEKEKNIISNGIDVDSKGRVWVVTLRRQFEEDEKAFVAMSATVDEKGGISASSQSLKGNTQLRKTDIFELEVFDKDGYLLGRIPLDHFVDQLRIFDDKLYIIDKLRGMQIYEYKIADTD